MDGIEGVPEVTAGSLKGLGDKSYDKRKTAAQEITTVVSQFYVGSTNRLSYLEEWQCGQGEESAEQAAVGLLALSERVLSQRRAHCRWIHRSRSRYGCS